MSNPNVQPATADSLARLYTPEAIGTLVQIMRGEIVDKAARTRADAAQALLDRGHGRAVQATIALPASRAKAMQLAGLDDAALLAIASRGRGGGSREQNEGPVPPGPVAGSHQPGADSFAQNAASAGVSRPADEGDYEPPAEGTTPTLPPQPRAKAQRRLPFGHSDAEDATLADEIDPLS